MLSFAPLVIFVVLLWIRPEYRFLLFYVAANTALVILFTVWQFTPEELPFYLFMLLISNVPLFVVGVIVVALRKWLKGRKTGAEKAAEVELERFRAEKAARDAQPPNT